MENLASGGRGYHLTESRMIIHQVCWRRDFLFISGLDLLVQMLYSLEMRGQECSSSAGWSKVGKILV